MLKAVKKDKKSERKGQKGKKQGNEFTNRSVFVEAKRKILVYNKRKIDKAPFVKLRFRTSSVCFAEVVAQAIAKGVFI